MNTSALLSRSSPVSLFEPHVVEGGDPSVLSAIHKRAINLALWRRDEEAPWRLFCTELAQRGFEAEHPDIGVTDVSAWLLEQLPPLSGSYQRAAAAWRHDVTMLAQLFSAHARTRRLRLVVESVAGMPCPKFHTDYVTLRLICTYVGAGTQWLPNDNVNMHADCCGGSLLRDNSRIEAVPQGAVALMKGRAWPGNPMGIYHRSPEPDKSSVRLVLKMDVSQ